jgi:hypothetical protein
MDNNNIIIKENFQIFLDLDGVLCDCYWKKCPHDKIDQEHVFKPKSIKALNRIISYYNADLIMISGWNSKFKDSDHYSEFLKNRGVIVNNLIIGDQHNRKCYIEDLIDMGMIDKYLIIDDESHSYFRQSSLIEYKRILAPNRYRCLDNFDVLHVTKNWKLNV